MTAAAAFFEAGKTYTHTTEDGEASGEGLFLVTHVGRAPEPFEHHSETLGVAFGWRWGLSPNGVWEGLGSYTTPDFAGWVEIPPPPPGDKDEGLICERAKGIVRAAHIGRRAPAGRLIYLANRLEAALEDGTLLPSVLATIMVLRTTATELGGERP